jgi:hypothetical protein
MDRILPIGPPGPDPQPVEPVSRRQDDERPTPERKGKRGKPRPPAPPAEHKPQDEDEGPHVDVIA